MYKGIYEVGIYEVYKGYIILGVLDSVCHKDELLDKDITYHTDQEQIVDIF